MKVSNKSSLPDPPPNTAVVIVPEEVSMVGLNEGAALMLLRDAAQAIQDQLERNW